MYITHRNIRRVYLNHLQIISNKFELEKKNMQIFRTKNQFFWKWFNRFTSTAWLIFGVRLWESCIYSTSPWTLLPYRSSSIHVQTFLYDVNHVYERTQQKQRETHGSSERLIKVSFISLKIPGEQRTLGRNVLSN